MARRSFMTWLRTLFGPRSPAPHEATPANPAAALPSPPLIDNYDDRLPPSSQQTVREIRDMLGELEKRASERSLIDETLELQRLKTRHLPSLLRSYVEIPPEHRAEVFRETGQSASVLLNERLEKILDRLHEMSRQLARGNLNAFSENIRFVDMQYGSSSPFD
jgi:hypothetical protein